MNKHLIRLAIVSALTMLTALIAIGATNLMAEKEDGKKFLQVDHAFIEVESK